MHRSRNADFAISILIASVLALPATAQERVIAFEGAKIIDGTASAPITDGVLLIRGGTIMKVGTRNSVEIPSTAQRVDVRGKTIIPGLIDAHVHPGLIEGMDISAENYNLERIERDSRHHLFFGATHFVSLGFDRQAIFDLRQAQRDGRAGGARAYTAGHGFAPVGGWRTPVAHGSALDSDWYNRPRNGDEAKQIVRKEAQRNVDVIKVWVDDLRGTFIKMSSDLYGPIIEEAHRQNLSVGAHIVFLEDARDLLRYNVNFFAHSIRDREVDDEFLRLALAKGVVYMPTLLQARFPMDYADGPPAYLKDPELLRVFSSEFLDALATYNKGRFLAFPALPAVRRQFQVAMSNFKKIAAAGIPIVAGGDTGVPGRFHGLSIHVEMELLVQGGLTPVKAIEAATLNVARMLKIDRQYGSLHEGKVADFVVLNADPQEDITRTRSISAVWMNGIEVDRDKLLKQETRRGGFDRSNKSFIQLARELENCFHPFCHQH